MSFTVLSCGVYYTIIYRKSIDSFLLSYPSLIIIDPMPLFMHGKSQGSFHQNRPGFSFLLFSAFYTLNGQYEFLSSHLCHFQTDAVQAADTFRVDHFPGSSLKSDPAFFQSDHLMGKGDRLVDIVEHHDNGNPVFPVQLPDQLQEEIRAGKYLDSEEDLYSFLENYSS